MEGKMDAVYTDDALWRTFEFHEWHRKFLRKAGCFEKNKRAVEADGANTFLQRQQWCELKGYKSV